MGAFDMEITDDGKFPGFQAPALHSPVQSLIGQYEQERNEVLTISAFVLGKSSVMGYFMAAAMVEHHGPSITAPRLFQAEPALRALDASYWARAMALTDVLECMPADMRNEWTRQIRQHETPAFDPDTVVSTLRFLLAQRQHFFATRVDGVFRYLSKEHVTNAPTGFSKRMILGYMRTHGGYIDTDSANYVHDLRICIARFMGRGEPHANCTYTDLDQINTARTFGIWHAFDGGAFKLRLYMKGTVHLEVHPDMAWRLNAVLASLYPAAIPPALRRRPEKAVREKEHK